MRIDIMTLFPETLGDVLSESIIGRAQDRGFVRIECHQIRDYTKNKQMQVDDYPYGGGMGMVMQADPLFNCWKHICDEAGCRPHTIYMSPQGKVFNQETAKRLSQLDRFIIVCGHYEGVDERFIEECVDEEISIGDFVLTGGEIPAMAVADAVCRLCPGVLADQSCFTDESHWNGLLEYPQYSRPEIWHGRHVPSVLLSGNHAKIARWRRKQAIMRTLQRRPDMYSKLKFNDKEDKKIVEEIEQRQNVNFRLATLKDLDGIMVVISQAQEFLRYKGVDQWQNGYPTSEIFESDIEKNECWIALIDEEVVGVLTLSFESEPVYVTIEEGEWLTTGAKSGVIHRSAVSNKYRGSGLADELFSLAENICKKTGMESVRIDTHEDNSNMRNLLKRRGFQPCGIVQVDVGSEHDPYRIGYEKIL